MFGQQPVLPLIHWVNTGCCRNLEKAWKGRWYVNDIYSYYRCHNQKVKHASF